MGDILLKNGLPTVDVPGHCRGVFLPEIKKFLETTSRHPRHPQSGYNQEVTARTSKNGHPRHPDTPDIFRDVEDISKTTSTFHVNDIIYKGDVRDIRDVVSRQTEINQPNTTGLFKIDVPVEVIR
jgi:hypothetical protein